MLSKLKLKLCKVIDYGKTCCLYSKEFNNKIAVYSFLAFLYHADNGIGRYFTRKKHAEIKQYLAQSTEHTQKSYYNKSSVNNNISSSSYIWVCWWQGINSAPELVKNCIKSIEKNSLDHKVIIVTKDNYNDYVKLPDYIMEKFEDGKMCHANFADVLRVSLLADHGGIWLDATIFMSQPFESSLYNYAFCSNKRKNQKSSLLYPAKCRWGTYFMACGTDNIIFKYTRDVFFEFWKKNNMVIDYGMIDYIIDLGYDMNPHIRKLINDGPYSNEHIHLLMTKLNNVYNENEYNTITQNNNLHKLSYKVELSKNIGDKSTFYGYITNYAKA